MVGTLSLPGMSNILSQSLCLTQELSQRNTYCDWVAAEGNKDGQPSDKYWKYVDEALQNVRAEVGKKPEGERAECVKM
jgi:hypothetical protein